MEAKTIIVGAVALIAILLGAFILLSPPPLKPSDQGGEYPNPLGGPNTTMEMFASSLMHAERIYLVEDLRGLNKYPISRNNIMQCGVDFAGSEGVAGKEVNIYVLEGEECSASESGANLTIKRLSECHSTIESAFGSEGSVVIWIEKGYKPSIYERGLVVRVNETYSQGACSIRFVIPAPEEPAAGANGTAGGAATPAGQEGPESVTWEATPEIPTPTESAPEETEPAETAPEPVEPAPIPPYAD